MGHRKIMKVPLDFSWPLGKTWKGYVNPHPGPKRCKLCDGTGHNAETKRIADTFYDHEGFGTRWRYDYGVDPYGRPASRPPWRIIGNSLAWKNKITQDEVEALVLKGRLMDFTHTWNPDGGWKQKRWLTKGYYCSCKIPVPQLSPEHKTAHCMACGEDMILLDEDDIRLQIPFAEEVNAMDNRGGMGSHDAINRWILIETRAKRLGVYGKCQKCKGSGETKLPRKKKKKYKKWKEYEPPTGEGWQLWETTSEGSPKSPVFATADGLAEWCAENTTIFANEKMPKYEWLSLITEKEGMDMETGSMVIADGRYFGSVKRKKTKDETRLIT